MADAGVVMAAVVWRLCVGKEETLHKIAEFVQPLVEKPAIHMLMQDDVNKRSN